MSGINGKISRSRNEYLCLGCLMFDKSFAYRKIKEHTAVWNGQNGTNTLLIFALFNTINYLSFANV